MAGVKKGLEEVLKVSMRGEFFLGLRKFIQGVLVDRLFLATNMIRGSFTSTFPDLF